jgi:hypothetical protein
VGQGLGIDEGRWGDMIVDDRRVVGELGGLGQRYPCRGFLLSPNLPVGLYRVLVHGHRLSDAL